MGKALRGRGQESLAQPGTGQSGNNLNRASLSTARTLSFLDASGPAEHNQLRMWSSLPLVVMLGFGEHNFYLTS